MTEIQQTSWSRISADICGPLSTGKYVLVMIDNHSRYPVVETQIYFSRVCNTSDIYIYSSRYLQYQKSWRQTTIHRSKIKRWVQYILPILWIRARVTPLWPKAIGEAERFMRTLGKVIKTANIKKLETGNAHVFVFRNYRPIEVSLQQKDS